MAYLHKSHETTLFPKGRVCVGGGWRGGGVESPGPATLLKGTHHCSDKCCERVYFCAFCMSLILEKKGLFFKKNVSSLGKKAPF